MVQRTCLWTIILIRLTAMERPMLIVCRTSTPDMGSWLYKRRERVSCVPTCNDSLLSPHGRQDMTHCFEHLVPGLPHHDGLSSRTANKTIIFYLLGGGEIQHILSERENKRGRKYLYCHSLFLRAQSFLSGTVWLRSLKEGGWNMRRELFSTQQSTEQKQKNEPKAGRFPLRVVCQLDPTS